MLESDLPFEVSVEKLGKLYDIVSKGYDDFDGQLNHMVSAHPKSDRKTGHYLAFGYDLNKGCAHYSLFNKDRKLENYLQIPLISSRMLHDFCITEHYAIVPDLPMEFKPELAVKGNHVFTYNKEGGARYGVFKRNC
jgi:carotenoid cleavage dioxygenase